MSEPETYCEVIASLLMDKMVEVYLGDTYEQINLADVTKNISSIIVGKIIKGIKDCLVIDCFYVDEKTKQVKTGNLLYINGFNIKTICEINNNGSHNVVFTDPKFYKKVSKK